ncbi:MAG: pilus assembly protein PilM [Candidatus Omnitrophica bacterium]|nr:pilus assembly protein PilM [Candidatus Omnitrophota bacterium]
MKKKKIFSGLEIGDGFIKFAQAETLARTRTVSKLIIRELASPSAEDKVSALNSIVDQVNAQIGHLTLVIPRHKATVRFLSLPSVDKKEIEGMVRLRSSKELPFAKEEIISDFFITEQTKAGYSKVALVIIHQDVVSGFLGILKKAKLEPEKIALSTEALLSWYRLARKLQGTNDCSLLIDLDSDNIDLAVLHNYNLDFSRGLDFGAVQLLNSPALKSKLSQQLQRTVDGYARLDQARKVQRLLLGQAGPMTEQLKLDLEDELQLPCEIVVPFENLTCQKQLLTSAYPTELSLLRVLGSVVQTEIHGCNLLPLDSRKAKSEKLKTKKMQRIAIFSLGVLLLGSAIFAERVRDRRLALSFLEQEIRRIAPGAQQLEIMSEKIELIEKRKRLAGSSIDVLRELHTLTPANISFSSFSYDEEKGLVEFRGISEGMPEILQLVKAMEKSTYFKSAQLKYARAKKTKDADLIDFKIECSLQK